MVLQAIWMVKSRSVEIDFDGVIVDFHPSGSLLAIGEFKPGAVDFLRRLKACGFYVIISSGRPQACREHLEKHLMEADVPFNEVRCGVKPLVQYYIDDRAISFESWEQVRVKIGQDFPDVVAPIGTVQPLPPTLGYSGIRSDAPSTSAKDVTPPAPVLEGHSAYCTCCYCKVARRGAGAGYGDAHAFLPGTPHSQANIPPYPYGCNCAFCVMSRGTVLSDDDLAARAHSIQRSNERAVKVKCVPCGDTGKIGGMECGACAPLRKAVSSNVVMDKAEGIIKMLRFYHINPESSGYSTEEIKRKLIEIISPSNKESQ